MKILILGITGSGKSTLAPKLAEYFGLNLIEADDEVKRLNNGIWPKDERIIDKFFEVTNDEILKNDNVLYIISWLEKERIVEFNNAGFIIIELHADNRTLITRKQKRDNPDTEEITRFENNVEGYYEVTNDNAIAQLFTLSIDTTNDTIEDIKNKVIDKLTYKQLINIMTQIHTDCFTLCKLAINKYLPIAGNIGVFCQDEIEYKWLVNLKEIISEHSSNPLQKYFKLKKPIEIHGSKDIPNAIYTYLYIRKVDPSAYGKNRGDIDFVLDTKEYQSFKDCVVNNKVPYCSIYDRPGWDTVEIVKPEIHSVAYISTREFAEKVRIKFD